MDILSFVDSPYTICHENEKMRLLVTGMVTTWKTPCAKIIEFQSNPKSLPFAFNSLRFVHGGRLFYTIWKFYWILNK
jgi:hypothetical protein